MSSLPQISLTIAISENQRNRLDEMLARFNSHFPSDCPSSLQSHEDVLFAGLVEMECIMLHTKPDEVKSIFTPGLQHADASKE